MSNIIGPIVVLGVILILLVLASVSKYRDPELQRIARKIAFPHGTPAERRARLREKQLKEFHAARRKRLLMIAIRDEIRRVAQQERKR